MGLLFNIPSGGDRAIIAILNWQFSGAALEGLRQHQRSKGENLFDRKHHLARVVWRLGLFPSTGSNRPKARWLKFLRSILPVRVQNRIKAELSDALADPNCSSVTFQAVEDSSAADYNCLSNVVALPNGANSVALTLVCPQPVDPNDPGDPSEPPPDPGEQNFVLSARRRRVAAKRAKRAKRKRR
ncbi:MAG TPA: hypothetical protein VEU47_10200 [Candidatus Cybelea sp.]|nr:hypothetical protein [Candidatus Cybelea sp.]